MIPHPVLHIPYILTFVIILLSTIQYLPRYLSLNSLILPIDLEFYIHVLLY